jgi:hypothetical protein
MTDEDGAAIDPRYDPAFQRGFSGEVATGPRGQSTLRRTAAVNPAPARAPQRIQEPPIAPSTAPATTSVFAPASTPGAVAGDASAHPFAPHPISDAAPAGGVPMAAVGVSAVTPRELARNPFVVALAVLGAVLLIAGGLWAYEGFATIIKNGGTRNEVEFWAAQTMSFGAPLTIVLGLAVAAVLLVLFGRAWQRARV